jgi:hypothetical protein
LISSSTCHPGGYLDHAEGEIRGFLGRAKRVLLLPSKAMRRTCEEPPAGAFFGRANRQPNIYLEIDSISY